MERSSGSAGGGPAVGSNAAGKSRRVKVVLRARPFLEHEREAYKSVAVDSEKRRVNLSTPLPGASATEYSFDACYDESISQEALFEREIKPALPSLLQGINTTVFAYGMTGAGKTHTMQGSSDDPGIIPRAARNIMEMIDDSIMKHVVYASYLEIYNEKVYDLLQPSEVPLAIREDHSRNVVIPNLTQMEVTSFTGFEEIYQAACQNRSTSPTSLNNESSRSHAILILKVVTIDKVNRVKLTGKLHLIDLAGSEDNRLTENRGMRMTESTNINTSLFVLSKVVTALSNKSARIPYRDSKLTRMLSDSLGGKSVSIMIANVSPGYNFISETIRTLNFASKSKSIVNAPVVHSVTSDPVVEENSIRKKLEEWRKAKGRAPKRIMPFASAASTSPQEKENMDNRLPSQSMHKASRVEKGLRASNLDQNRAVAPALHGAALQAHIDSLVEQQLQQKLAAITAANSSQGLEEDALNRLEKLEQALSGLRAQQEETASAEQDVGAVDTTDENGDWLPEVDGLACPETPVKKAKPSRKKKDEPKKVVVEGEEKAQRSMNEVVAEALSEAALSCHRTENMSEATRLLTLASAVGAIPEEAHNTLATLQQEGYAFAGQCTLESASSALIAWHGCFLDAREYDDALRVARNAADKLALLNSATSQDLEKNLHGIGRKRAQLIVQQRANGGGFAKLQDLRAVLGEKQLQTFVRRNIVEAIAPQ